jgi:hypothetical protein
MNDLSLYEAVRSEMLKDTGGCIEWHADTALGRSIQFFSHAYFNHSSLLIPMKGRKEPRVFITEALGNGIVPNFLSCSLSCYEGEVYWYPLKDEWDSQRDIIEDRAFSYIGVPYDYEGVLRNAWQQLEIETDKMWCSEYVWVCYGYTCGKAPTPGDLAKMNMFKDPIRIL